jgi:hypothetical protein
LALDHFLDSPCKEATLQKECKTQIKHKFIKLQRFEMNYNIIMLHPVEAMLRGICKGIISAAEVTQWF